MYRKLITYVLCFIFITGLGYNVYGAEITISEFIKDDSIAGVVQGLSPDECKNYKIIVYVKTDNLYIHPFKDGGERATFSGIDASGNWWVKSVNRFPEPKKIYAFLVSNVYSPPGTVESFREISYADYDSVEYDERKVRNRRGGERICTQFPDQGQDNELRCLGIYLTDGDESKVKMIKSWLQNPWSGYPDLFEKVRESLKDCASFIQSNSINGVPLDNIEGWYRELKFGTRSKVEVKHDRAKMIEAYIMAWEEKNSGFSKQTKKNFAKTIKAGCPQ